MTHRQNLLEKVRGNKRNTSLVDFESLINAFGYIKEGSKHPQAIVSKMSMTYKRENPIKPAYVKKLLQVIDIQIDKG